MKNGFSTHIIEYVNISLWSLISSFVYHDFYSDTHSLTLKSECVASVISYMKENLNTTLSVQELADHANYSVPHFHAIFKDETGHSPVHYFNHLKIQKACQYLSFTNLSVKEISYKLGFDDPFYFSRVFKKMMEKAPTDYRKNHNG